jgi:hypothetical protein
VLDASPSNFPLANNPAFNSAQLSSGVGTATIVLFPNTTSVIYHTYPSGGGESALGVTSAFPAEDHLISQFRAFAVNSQGEGRQFAQSVCYILLDSYGFGSDARPNVLGMLAAYNLGLRDDQIGDLSQPDPTFPLDPPLFDLIGVSIQSDPSPGEEGATRPSLLPIPQSPRDHDQALQDRKESMSSSTQGMDGP